MLRILHDFNFHINLGFKNFIIMWSDQKPWICSTGRITISCIERNLYIPICIFDQGIFPQQNIVKCYKFVKIEKKDILIWLRDNSLDRVLQTIWLLEAPNHWIPKTVFISCIVLTLILYKVNDQFFDIFYLELTLYIKKKIACQPVI